MTQQPPTPAGWYTDPHNAQQNRWWDGTAWTDHVQPIPAPVYQQPTSIYPTTFASNVGRGPWPKRHPVWTGVIGVIVLLIVIGAATGSNGSGHDSTPTVAPLQSVSPTATSTGAPNTASQPVATNEPTDSVPRATAPAPAKPTIVFSKSGNGTAQTQDFSVSDNWALKYSYNCSSFGQSGNFQIYVYGSDGGLSLSNTGANELGLRGSDVIYEHHGGTYYFEVNSECAWHVAVETLPS